jgi:hypothetical protein
MKVTLATHGGFAAGIRQPARSVDASTLAAPAAQELTRLIAAATSAPESSAEGPGRARDAMSYTITVEGESGEPTTLRGSDTNMAPAFAALLQWLSQHLRAR